MSIPAAPGIYKITCTANKKIYVGSAVNLHKRCNAHFNALRQHKHKNPHLQNAWNKYGEQSFTFSILEYVLPISLTAREQYWFKKLKPFGRKGFNILREAGSTLGMKQSPETIEKLRQAKLGKAGYKPSPETREKLRQVSLGREISPEQREKLRQANLGHPGYWTGKKHTPEHIEKNRQSALIREARKREQVSA